MIVRKNVCVVIKSLGMGGAEKQALLLVQALKPFHNVILVVVDPTIEVYAPRLKTLQQEAIDPIYLPKNLMGKVTKLTSLLKKKEIEFIFSYLATDNILSAICGKISRVPYKFGGIRSSLIPRFKLMALKAAHNHLLNYTIANNYAGHGRAIEFGFNNKVLVIPNGIEIRPLRSRESDDKKITIISLGRLVKAKRYDIAVQTMAHLKTLAKDDCTINYKIVGQGPEEKAILEAIENYDVREEVEIVTDASDMYALLEKSDIYLCTSYFEGISNALMEAMNCALPIVATDVGDNSRLVLDQKNGFLVTVNDHEALAEKLNRLIERPKVRKQMGAESFNHLIANFSFEVFQKKYLDLIANVGNIEIQNGEFFVKEKEASAMS